MRFLFPANGDPTEMMHDARFPTGTHSVRVDLLPGAPVRAQYGQPRADERPAPGPGEWSRARLAAATLLLAAPDRPPLNSEPWALEAALAAARSRPVPNGCVVPRWCGEAPV